LVDTHSLVLPVHFFSGLASLEALELLSVTCVNSLTHSDDLEGDLGDDLQTTFDSLAEKFSQIYDSDEGT